MCQFVAGKRFLSFNYEAETESRNKGNEEGVTKEKKDREKKK